MVTRELYRIEISAQSRAQQLFTSRQFAEWMTEGRSATLLVNANFDTPPGSSRVTTLFVLCAMLTLRVFDRDNKRIASTDCMATSTSRTPSQAPTALVHYSLRLQPSAVSGESGFSQRSLLAAVASAGRLGYYRAQMQRNWEDEMDSSDTNDGDSAVQYGPEGGDERVYHFA
jgi:hypothetical protein